MSNLVPVVFKAIYSSTEVYECSYNDVPIMRRCKDDWVNATQILKCCNFPKARRTKILEKGVQLGLHEKVQGGFGRFQGTWVPLPDAQRLAAAYGLLPHHAPVLHLDLSDPNLKFAPRPRPPPKEPTPVKRKYTKKIKLPVGTPTKSSRGHSMGTSMDLNDTSTASFASVNGSFTDASHNSFVPMNNHDMLPQLSFTTPDAYAQMLTNESLKRNEPQAFFSDSTKAPEPPSFPPPRSSFHQYQLLAPTSQPQLHQQQPHQTHHQPHHQPHQQQQSQQHQQHQFQKQIQHRPRQLDPFQGSMPHTGVFLSTPTGQTQYMPNNYVFPDKLNSLSTIESSHDDLSKPRTKESDTSVSSAEDYNSKTSFYGDASKDFGPKTYAAQLLRFFSDDSQSIPQFLYTTPPDFNIDQAIDDEGHTALHWAASIGNCDMIHLLLTKSANSLTVNNFGLNPLSKLILFNNCYEMRNFDRVLNDLETCLIHTDINGRTPLHYLMEFSKTNSKRESLGYYLDMILYKLHAMSEANQPSKVDLVRNVIDHRDVNGDTCLHLAIKSGSMDFCKILVHHGARDDLANANKETARFLMSQLDFHEPLTKSNLLQMPRHPLTHDSALQMPQIFVHDQPAPQAVVTNSQQGHPFIMETPVQAIADTPDTHRTTIARGESEDESENAPASVSNRQLESLQQKMGETGTSTPVTDKENKENIFFGSTPSKMALAIATPQRNSYHLSNSVQVPLPAILEHTDESTPKKELGVLEPICRVTHLPRPPQLDANGRLISCDGTTESDRRTALPELSKMVLGMIHSLEDSYAREKRHLESSIHRLSQEAAQKRAQIDGFLIDLQQKLVKSGFECPESFAAASRAIDEASGQCTEELHRLNSQAQRSLSKLYMEKVSECLTNTPEPNDPDSSHDSVALALKLTKLQLDQNTLVQRYAHGIMSYGADDKMYKFRKLIGLSCGVRVEEVDLLIDRILLHLMDSGSQ